MTVSLNELVGKHIICYSGGHSSALVAIEVVRKYGKENVVLLNHDINQSVENEDIKRFKREVAEYLGLPITFANHKDFETKDQFDIATSAFGRNLGILVDNLNTAGVGFSCFREEEEKSLESLLLYKGALEETNTELLGFK